MKSLTSKLMVAAMAVGAVASVASAQVMKSEVPFPFRVAGTVMPAGSYQITDERGNSGVPIFRLVNTDLHKPVLALPNGHTGALYGPTDTKLVFQCGESGCMLSQIWTGKMLGAYSFPTRRRNHEEVSLIVVKADRAAE
jgi:hypothetical protein